MRSVAGDPVKSLQKNPELLKTDPLLGEMVTRLVAEFHPHKIFLFGSRAMGTARDNSDYDILVVMPGEIENGRELSLKAREILDHVNAATDIHFTYKDKFERRKTVMNTLAEIATTDGIELYAA